MCNNQKGRPKQKFCRTVSSGAILLQLLLFTFVCGAKNTLERLNEKLSDL